MSKDVVAFCMQISIKKGPSKKSQTIYKVRTESAKETWQLRRNLKKCTVINGTITGPSPF